ncbi:MAG: S1 family peptidase [Neomegalonema sp.]|nr:S1 family peptidase [Neomegalonema sp.]
MLSLVLGIGAAQAEQPNLMPGLVGADDRKIAALEPWMDAVGRLNLPGGGFCTATLIAPDVVLTAAHCLIFARTGKVMPADRIHFLAGYRKGDYRAHRIGEQAQIPATYLAGVAQRRSLAQHDIALVHLAEPITEIQPLSLAKLPPIERALSTLSYARDRSELPSIERGCHRLAPKDDPTRSGSLFATDCDVNFGASGGPLLLEQAGEAKVLAVMIAYQRKGARVRTLAVEALDWAHQALQNKAQ